MYAINVSPDTFSIVVSNYAGELLEALQCKDVHSYDVAVKEYHAVYGATVQSTELEAPHIVCVDSLAFQGVVYALASAWSRGDGATLQDYADPLYLAFWFQ